MVVGFNLGLAGQKNDPKCNIGFNSDVRGLEFHHQPQHPDTRWFLLSAMGFGAGASPLETMGNQANRERDGRRGEWNQLTHVSSDTLCAPN